MKRLPRLFVKFKKRKNNNMDYLPLKTFMNEIKTISHFVPMFTDSTIIINNCTTQVCIFLNQKTLSDSRCRNINISMTNP